MKLIARFGGIIAVAAAIAGASIACGKTLPPNTPADVQSALDCVAAAVLAGTGLADCILKYGPALIADALQLLLNSKTLTIEQSNFARGQLAGLKAKLIR